MTDLSLTIAPKSDQLNSDDLISGPRTITVTRVSGNDNADQPVSIYFEGDGNKPFKPCKSMRRVLVNVWGKDGTQYAGRSMTIYRDPEVVFGGLKVGGIRISHVSGIDRDVTMALTESRAKRKPFVVKPLKAETPKPKTDQAAFDSAQFVSKVELYLVESDLETLTAWWESPATIESRKSFSKSDPERAAETRKKVADRIAELKSEPA